jgi:predicted DNA repair protein MutK
MTLLPILSTTAIVIGLAAALPQLATMFRTRSAAGQSSLGWSLGAFVNFLMAYVNFVGYKATMLAAGNVASVALCLIAVGLVARFGDAGAESTEDERAVRVHELETTEFWALRDQLEHEARRRDERRGLVPIAA